MLFVDYISSFLYYNGGGSHPYVFLYKIVVIIDFHMFVLHYEKSNIPLNMVITIKQYINNSEIDSFSFFTTLSLD